ncbi:MAG: histidine kinase [Bacteroidales bacterium]|jgi:sensor histidine kinase YesM|nr:histidine kinase [Bacteroidales bacterium]
MKNFGSYKKFNFQLFKLILWVSMAVLFTGFSLLLPSSPAFFIHEVSVFLFLFIVINLHISYVYPRVLKKNKWLYLLVLTLSLILCTCFEMYMFKDSVNIICLFVNDKRIAYLVCFGYVAIRDLALFCFFLWVESFHRMVLLYEQTERIHKEEILLLREKQEFEKKFSRVKLMPHYFFNILETVHSRTVLNKENRELFEKVKFILYYFLVDAEKEKVELEKELVFYNYYIELEKLRRNGNITVRFEILGEPGEISIIPLLFEPLIGNAMKYAKRDESGWVEIGVDITQQPNISFHCKNNFSEPRASVHSSESGLKILQQRLEFCYRNNYRYEVIQSDDIYEVRLTVRVA